MMQKRCCSRAEGPFVCLAQPSGLGSRPGLDVRANGPAICPQRSSKWPGRWPSPFIALRYPARRAGLDKVLGLWPEDAGSISAPPPSTSTFIAPCSIFDIQFHMTMCNIRMTLHISSTPQVPGFLPAQAWAVKSLLLTGFSNDPFFVP